MKKWIAATFMTVAVFAMSTGAGTSIAATPTEDSVEIGSCRYQCETTGTWYMSRSACNAACTGFCEGVC